MTSIERHQDHHGQQSANGPVVWILEEGEMHEGGNVLGVYLDRELAAGQFLDAAHRIGSTFGIDDIRQDMDGGITVEGGRDWLTLTPYPVTTRNEIG